MPQCVTASVRGCSAYSHTVQPKFQRVSRISRFAKASVIPWRRVLLSFSLRYYEIFSSHGGEFLIVIRQIRTEDVQKYFIRLLSLSSFILPYFSSSKAMRFRLLAITTSFLSYV